MMKPVRTGTLLSREQIETQVKTIINDTYNKALADQKTGKVYFQEDV